MVFTHDQGTNGIGRLTGMTDPGGTTTFTYDGAGNRESATTVIDGSTFVTRYTYDSAGYLTGIEHPDGLAVNYTLNPNGTVSGVSVTRGVETRTLASGIDHLPFGPVRQMTLGNGIGVTRGFDQRYRVASIAADGVQNLDYTYSTQGFVESITNHLDDSHLVGVTEGQDTFGYDTGTSRLTSISGPAPESLTHDANGNVTTKGNLSFIYDDNNRLVEVKDAGATVATYVYNGFGQRVKKVAAGETVIYHYDASGHLIAESDAAGQCWTHYIYLGDEIIAQVINDPANCSLENTYYVHNDHLGTPQKLTDATGSVVWFAIYTPYGEADVHVEAVVNNVRFPGQYYDQETGLHYNYHRYYDPATGRYLTPDPIGLDGGINLYAYVQNNPINWVDPEGLQGGAPSVPGIPLFPPILPPVFIPGTPENDMFVDDVLDMIDAIGDVFKHEDDCKEEEKDCGKVKNKCIERCWRILERPKKFPGDDSPTWDFHKCVNKCMRNNGC